MKVKAGPYEVEVTARRNCRRLILRCTAERKLVMSVPVGTSRKTVQQFLDGHVDWMARHAGAPQSWTAAFLPGERHWLLGRLITLGREAPAGEAAFAGYRAAQLQAAVGPMLGAWAKRMGVQATHVTLREMTSKWGSCRPRTARLTLNLRLGAYAPELIEYVVVHELCHLRHADHSAAFYGELARWLPDWRERKRALSAFDARPLPPL